jgi:hypothetical protein
MDSDLTRSVSVFDGATDLSARPAFIELTDDNLFTLAKLDPSAGALIETIFDNVPVAEIKVGGGIQPTLTFTHLGVRKRVNFSFGGPNPGAFGFLGLTSGARMVEETGIREWTAALKAGGATMRLWRQGRIIGLVSLCVLVVVIAALLVQTVSPG